MKKICLILLLLTIILSGCRQQKPAVKRYYVIEMPSEQINNEREIFKTIDKYCQVNPVVIFPAFSTNRIALRKNTHEINYFRDHEWATRPSENLTSITINFLEKYQVFKGASTRYWKVVPDFNLETTIYKLEVVDDTEGMSAHLQLEFRLVDKQTDDLIISHTADTYKQLEENKINLFALAISELYYKELYNFSRKITQEL